MKESLKPRMLHDEADKISAFVVEEYLVFGAELYLAVVVHARVEWFLCKEKST